jgi:hypothetical protein
MLRPEDSAVLSPPRGIARKEKTVEPLREEAIMAQTASGHSDAGRRQTTLGWESGGWFHDVLNALVAAGLLTAILLPVNVTLAAICGIASLIAGAIFVWKANYGSKG